MNYYLINMVKDILLMIKCQYIEVAKNRKSLENLRQDHRHLNHLTSHIKRVLIQPNQMKDF
jgi:hypothetical protein